MSENSCSADKINEIIEIIKRYSHNENQDIEKVRDEIWAKLSVLSTHIQSLFILEIIDMIGIYEIYWLYPVLKKSLDKIQDYLLQNPKMLKKLIYHFENTENYKDSSKKKKSDKLYILFGITKYFYQKIPKLPLYIHKLILESSIDDIAIIIPLILEIPIKNLMFILCLILQNYLNIKHKNSSLPIDKHYQDNAKILTVIIQETEFNDVSKCECFNTLKQYFDSENDIFSMPFLMSIFLIFGFDQLNDYLQILQIIFRFKISKNPELSSENYFMLKYQIEIDDLFMKMINILKYVANIKNLEKIHVFLVNFAAYMLNFNKQKKLDELINDRGMHMIIEIFNVFNKLRTLIIEYLLKEILKNSNDLFAKILHSCCTYSKDSLYSSLANIESTFRCLVSIDIERAKVFISVVIPFVKIDASMKDSFLLLMRKLMLSNNKKEQQLAILGYIMILKNFRSVRGDVDLTQCTHYANDSYGLTQKFRQFGHDQLQPLQNQIICLEIFDYLSRCFLLHNSTRIFICLSLKEVAGSNFQIMDPIINLLLTEYNKTIDNIKDNSVVYTHSQDLKNCEMMPYIISTLVYCVNISNEKKVKEKSELTKHQTSAYELLTEVVESIITDSDIYSNNKVKAYVAMTLIEFCLNPLNQIENYKAFELFDVYNKNKSDKSGDDIDINKDSLISLSFIMSEAWKFLSVESVDYYNKPNYSNFIIDYTSKTVKYYISKMTATVDGGKTVITKLSSTIQFCSIIITNSAILYKISSNEKEVSHWLDQITEILYDIFHEFTIIYKKIPIELLKIFDETLIIEIENDLERAPSVLIKLLKLIDQSDCITDFSRTSWLNIVKIFNIVFNNSILDDSILILNENIYNLLSQKFDYLDDKLTVNMLFEAFLSTIQIIDDQNDRIKSLIYDISQYDFNVNNSELGVPTEFGFITNSNYQTVSKIIMTFLATRISTISNKINILKNKCKITKVLEIKKGKPDSFEDSSISLKEFFLSVKEDDSIEISQELFSIHNIICEYKPLCHTPEIRMQFYKTADIFYQCLSQFVTCQKEMVSTKYISSFSEEFENLIAFTIKELTAAIYNIVEDFSSSIENENDQKISKKRKKSATAFNEYRTVPCLIFSIEKCEKEIASISKLLNVDIKSSVFSNNARDFKILQASNKSENS